MENINNRCLKRQFEYGVWTLNLLKERGVALLKDVQEFCKV